MLNGNDKQNEKIVDNVDRNIKKIWLFKKSYAINTYLCFI